MANMLKPRHSSLQIIFFFFYPYVEYYYWESTDRFSLNERFSLNAIHTNRCRYICSFN